MKKLLILLVLIIACVGMGFFLVSKWTETKHQEAAVIQQIQMLSRWETSSYTVQQIIDDGSKGNVFQEFLFGNRILLVAQGTVVGGFDLANLSEDSIHINGESIEIELPSSEILSASLNESQTRVYDRQKGLLVSDANNLESEARVSALGKIREAACREGILDAASENAKKQLTAMLKSLGFTNVIIKIPRGSC